MSASRCVVCELDLCAWFARHGRQVYRCRECGHIQVPAGLARTADGRSIYEQEHAEIFEGSGTADYYLDDGALDAARSKLGFVERLAGKGGKLLDLGANFGHFLSVAGSSYDAMGIEPNPSAVAWSRSEFGVGNAQGSIYELSDHCKIPPRIMTAWDVIEHLDDPRRALRECRSHIMTGGWIFLSTPDTGSLVARAMGRRWHYQDPVQHINLLSRRNLDRLLLESGFRAVEHITLGRTYRLSYILSRIEFLLDTHPLARPVRMMRRLPRSWQAIQLPIRLGDVMGVAARAI